MNTLEKEQKTIAELYHDYVRWAGTMLKENEERRNFFYEKDGKIIRISNSERQQLANQYYYLKNYIETARKIADNTIYSAYPQHHTNTYPSHLLKRYK